MSFEKDEKQIDEENNDKLVEEQQEIIDDEATDDQKNQPKDPENRIKIENREVERKEIEDLINSLQLVVNVFRERESKRLTPLIDNKGLEKINSIVVIMKRETEKEKVNLEDFSSYVVRSVDALDHIGPIRAQIMNEDIDNLGKTIFQLKKTEDNALILKKKLGSKLNLDSDEKGRALLESLGKLNSLCHEKWQFVARKRDRYAEYLKRN